MVRRCQVRHRRHQHADQRAVFSPRTVVVLHVLLSEDLVQNEPGVRAAFPDPAVGNDVFVPVQAGTAIAP